MTEIDELFLVCDDTNNVPFDEIDVSAVPSELLDEVNAILAGAKDEAVAA